MLKGELSALYNFVMQRMKSNSRNDENAINDFYKTAVFFLELFKVILYCSCQGDSIIGLS